MKVTNLNPVGKTVKFVFVPKDKIGQLLQRKPERMEIFMEEEGGYGRIYFVPKEDLSLDDNMFLRGMEFDFEQGF